MLSERHQSDFFPAFSQEEFKSRHERVRAAMRARGLDCLVIYGFHHYNGNDVGQTNVVWLASFANVVQSYVVFPVAAEPTLVVGLPFHLPVAQKLSCMGQVVADPTLAQGMIRSVRAVPQGVKRIGLVGYHQGLTLPYEHRRALEAAVAEASFEDVTEWFLALRLVLSQEERSLMERAGGLSDRVHERVVAAMKPGVTHAEVCREVGLEALGAGGHWALSHVGSTPMANPEGFYPNFYATYETLRPGDIAQTELAVGYGNYLVKTTASYFIGEPSPEYRQLFDVAREIYLRCVDELKPGMTGEAVSRFTDPATRAGMELSQPIIGGFSTYNTAPWAGAIRGSRLELLCRSHERFVFEPGHSVFIIGTPNFPGTAKGVWVGQTCLMTESGLVPLGKYPVERLQVIPVS